MLRALSRQIFRNVTTTRSVKTTTGIVGLPVDPNARENLTKNLHKIKELMAELVPETAYYRTIVVADVDEKLKILEENECDEAAEDAMGFKLEQVIEMTEDELKLIPFMAEHKPWDVPPDHEVPVYEGYDPYETGFWEGPPGVFPDQTEKPSDKTS